MEDMKEHPLKGCVKADIFPNGVCPNGKPRYYITLEELTATLESLYHQIEGDTVINRKAQSVIVMAKMNIDRLIKKERELTRGSSG
jgi:hypothetical protein